MGYMYIIYKIVFIQIQNKIMLCNYILCRTILLQVRFTDFLLCHVISFVSSYRRISLLAIIYKHSLFLKLFMHVHCMELCLHYVLTCTGTLFSIKISLVFSSWVFPLIIMYNVISSCSTCTCIQSFKLLLYCSMINTICLPCFKSISGESVL